MTQPNEIEKCIIMWRKDNNIPFTLGQLLSLISSMNKIAIPRSQAIEKKVLSEKIDKIKSDLIIYTDKYKQDFCVTLFNEHIEKLKQELLATSDKTYYDLEGDNNG